MKISYNWLKEYLDFTSSPEETAHILTFCGLEVEGIESFSAIEGNLEGVVLGEVLSCAKHPDADRLTICQVDYGTGPVQIVCGAPNVAAGQKVLVATVGTTLFPGGKELLIKKSKIRGQDSEGMICAEDELGLGSSHQGIMVLDTDAPNGTPAAEHLGLMADTVFEIGLTPNRSDAASHIGTARDLAAYFNIQPETDLLKLKYPDISAFKVDDRSLPIPVEIIDLEGCQRYSGISISDIKVEPSPAWLQDRLKAVGLRPLNNVVDITNYVLMELGHPLHAFDADKIRGQKVVIRCENESTEFTTLDGVKRSLSASDLMICDTEGGMCIAGVFGGEGSGVSQETKRIFLESAYFSPSRVRKTARRHGLNTDASFRFERGADPGITLIALKRAALLIKEICGGRISSDVVDVYPTLIQSEKIILHKKNLKRMAGFELDAAKVERILTSLEFRISETTEDSWTLYPPLCKVDVTREADVMEEILRIYGYNNIPLPMHISFPPDVKAYGDEETLRNTISDALVARGFNEAMNNSLTRSSYAKLGFYSAENSVKMLNALSSELDVMRQSLLPGMLETISHNMNRQNKDLRLFEFGVIYNKKSDQGSILDRFEEKRILSFILSGRSHPENWRDSEKAMSIFELRHELEGMLSSLGLGSEMAAIPAELPFSEMLVYKMGTKELGRCGRIAPQILKTFSIEQAVYYAELDFDLLSRKAGRVKSEFNPLPRFPEVRRDLAIVINKDCRYNQIEAIALKAGKPYLRDMNLFDVYEGEGIGKEKVSYALSFVLRDDSSTLTDTQIESTMSRILRALEQDLGARLR